MYELIISEPAKKFIRQLQVKQISKIINSIETLSENPRPRGSKKLVGSNIYRIRVGDFRILYAIDDKIKIVDIRKVGYRKNIYE